MAKPGSYGFGFVGLPKHGPEGGKEMREFDTGATRDSDETKPDYEGFLSPHVLRRYAEYMHKNRVQADGKLRDSDNWQKGIPMTAYMKSAWRHFMDLWTAHRDVWTTAADLDAAEEAACALLFNVMGYIHEMRNGSTPGQMVPVDDVSKHGRLP